MTFETTIGRTTVWKNRDAYGIWEYHIFPPFSPPTVDVEASIMVCYDRDVALKEAKHIDDILCGSFGRWLKEQCRYRKIMEAFEAYNKSGRKEHEPYVWNY